MLLLAVPSSAGDPAEAPAAGEDPAASVPGAREISDARWAVTSAALAGRSVGDLPAAWIGEELALIEAAEAVKAWVEFQSLAALHRLRDAVGEQCAALYDDTAFLTSTSHRTTRQEEHEADQAAVDEVVAATGLSLGDVTQRLQIAANTDGRATVMLTLLAAGQTPLTRVKRVHDATGSATPTTSTPSPPAS